MSMKHLISSIFLIGWIAACLAGPEDVCPPLELTTPCVCTRFETNTCVGCENLSENDELMNAVKETSEYAFGYFWLRRCSVQYFPAEAFQIKKITGVIMEDTTMNSLFDETPKAKDLLEIHTINLKLLRSMKWELFAEMSSLKIFNVSNTHIPSIDEAFIENIPKSLERLVFMKSSIKSLIDKAFVSMTNLTDIFVDYGKIKELKRTMFPSPAKIFGLSFTNQRIESLPDDLFYNMPDLTYVFLQGNLISEITENLLKDTAFRRFNFYIQDNPIKCNCNFRWIVSKNTTVSNQILGRCEEPKNLHGIFFYYLTPENFAHCA